MTDQSTSATMPELLPCPWCGKKPIVGLGKKGSCQLHGEPYQCVVISCTWQECPARPCVSRGDIYNGGRPLAQKEAAEVWNTRANAPGKISGADLAKVRDELIGIQNIALSGLCAHRGKNHYFEKISMEVDKLLDAQPSPAPVVPSQIKTTGYQPNPNLSSDLLVGAKPTGTPPNVGSGGMNPTTDKDGMDKVREYVPGSWFHADTVDEMEAFFISRLPAIREAAKALGYAIAVHGSMRRDMDLMAMAWRDDAAPKDDLARAIQMAACGLDQSAYGWEQKPSGRVATSFSVCWCEWQNMVNKGHVDLSLIDQQKPATPEMSDGVWSPAMKSAAMADAQKVCDLTKEVEELRSSLSRNVSAPVPSGVPDAVELLEIMYSRWETDGMPCYEYSDGEQGSYIGRAIDLSDDEEKRICALLNAAAPTPASLDDGGEG